MQWKGRGREGKGVVRGGKERRGLERGTGDRERGGEGLL